MQDLRSCFCKKFYTILSGLLRLRSGLHSFRLISFKSNLRVWDFHILLTLFPGRNFVFLVMFFLLMIRPPFLNLFFSSLLVGVFLLIYDFPIGLIGSSLMMMTFSMIAGLYTALEFNLNLF
jgi:hypothetical protein